MATSDTQRTRTHQYPTKELDAMIRFYGGKMRSIIKDMTGAEWAHVMDAALSGSNEMVYCAMFLLFQPGSFTIGKVGVNAPTQPP